MIGNNLFETLDSHGAVFVHKIQHKNSKRQFILAIAIHQSIHDSEYRQF